MRWLLPVAETHRFTNPFYHRSADQHAVSGKAHQAHADSAL